MARTWSRCVRSLAKMRLHYRLYPAGKTPCWNIQRTQPEVIQITHVFSWRKVLNSVIKPERILRKDNSQGLANQSARYMGYKHKRKTISCQCSMVLEKRRDLCMNRDWTGFDESDLWLNLSCTGILHHKRNRMIPWQHSWFQSPCFCFW